MDTRPSPSRILIAVDGGEPAERAAATAHRLFGDEPEYLSVHVTAPEEPVHAVVQAAHELAADVIVVGSRGRGWFRRLFDRSVSSHVVGASDRPVLVVRDVVPVPTEAPRLVIVATDASEGSLHAARTARRLFGPHPWYEVVHVAPDWPDPNIDATGLAGPLIDNADADAIYQEAVDRAEDEVAVTAREIDAPHVSETVLIGDPVVRLCEWSRDAAADVLVIAATSTAGLLHVLLGSVSEHVVTHAEVPVLVVPAPR